MRAPKFDMKHLKKAKGYIVRNVVNITDNSLNIQCDKNIFNSLKTCLLGMGLS